jgi:hypothetical protein
MSLKGILSITINKTMIKNHQWLYEWLYSYNIIFNPMWKKNLS